MDENTKIENAIKILLEERQPHYYKECSIGIVGDAYNMAIEALQEKIKHKTQPIKKQDYYKMGCNCDDENKENDCFHCERFLFPIGCMIGIEDED